ncbi:MAG: hypothetical protein F6J97_06140 [Leptolyngbya sp. SIO4C1]|nr:hypothetical protein [Leptolyngbya sp. SIO4C1]
MLQYAMPDAAAFTVSPTLPEEPAFEDIHVSVRGSLAAVRLTIQTLHKLNYAEPNDWSQPQPTGRGQEVIVVLRRRLRIR